MNDAPGNRISVYVSSFDDYADIWDCFFQMYFRYWPDCPYPVYLGSVEKVYPDSRVLPLHSGNYRNWSSRAVEHLGQLDTPYVLMMLEDYLIDRHVDTAHIEHIVDLMDLYDLHAVRLSPYPAPDIGMSGVPILGFQKEGQLNRTSTQATIWRRTSLLELIRPGESLWEFEINGSIRSNRFPGGVCGCWRPAIHYVMGVGKGRWFRRALRTLKANGLRPDLSFRRAETPWEEICTRSQMCLGAVVRTVLPLHIRQHLKQLFFPSSYEKR